MKSAQHVMRLALVAALVLVFASGAGYCLTISGHFRNLEGGGVGGILVYAPVGISTYTAADGSYSLTVPIAYSGHVGPVDDSILQTPIDYAYVSITTNQTNQDYVATPVRFYSRICWCYNPAHTTNRFNMGRGAIAWADYDNSGVLDVALAGCARLLDGTTTPVPLAKVFHKDSADNYSAYFTEAANLAGVQDAALAWTDYDNDGKLDMVLTGDTGSAYITKLYHGSGAGFSEIATGIPGVTKGCVAWGDYNNDGKPDLLITGTSSAGRVTKLYRNTGNGAFSEVIAFSMPKLSDSAAAWADYDNDGLMDFAIAGSTGTNYITSIYHNNGNGSFTDIAAGLTGVAGGSLAWGDYDNDGRLDLASCGVTVGNTKITRICHNNGSTFTEQNLGLPGCQGQMAWGDYDNDGKLDLAMAGDQGAAAGGSVPKVYHNNGSGSFTGFIVQATGLTNAAVAWGDHDADGKLDLMVAGYGNGSASYPGTFLYENAGMAVNTRPTAPTGLVSNSTSTTLMLSWSAATDSQTPQAGLTYNIRVGTSPGAGDVVSGMADYSSGVRRLPAMGNVQRNLSWTVQGITPRTYYWSVQAIDGAFAGSAWAAEKSVTATAKPVYGLTIRGLYDHIMNTAFLHFFFAVCGKVTRIDANSFYLNDGSGYQVKVVSTAHGLSTGNYAWAKGSIDPSLNPRVLTAQTIKKVN